MRRIEIFSIAILSLIIGGTFVNCGDCSDELEDTAKDKANELLADTGVSIGDGGLTDITVEKEYDIYTYEFTINMEDLKDKYPEVPEGGEPVKKDEKIMDIPAIDLPLAEWITKALSAAGYSNEVASGTAAMDKIDKIIINKVVYDITDNSINQPGAFIELRISEYQNKNQDDSVLLVKIPQIKPNEPVSQETVEVPADEQDTQGEILRSGEFTLFILPMFSIDTEKYPDPPAGKAKVKITLYAKFVVKPLE